MRRAYSIAGNVTAADEKTILALCAKEALGGAVTTASLVYGSDALRYQCILSHTATTDKKPITGANWALYWQTPPPGTIRTTSFWASGTFYTSASLSPIVPSLGRIYDINLAVPGSGAAIANKFNIVRSPQGTPIAIEPQSLNPEYPASRFNGATEFTVAPPYVSGDPLMTISLSQRGTFRWQTVPRYGLEISGADPATDCLRLMFAVGTTVTGEATHTASFVFEE